MCGRYALGVRLAYVQQRLQEQGMRVDEAPDDDTIRETYNFAPGNFGAVYRAERVIKERNQVGQEADADNEDHPLKKSNDGQTKEENPSNSPARRYKLQSMKWGLIPFWTKRQPDWGSMMRTINCRDDSLIEDYGMWTTMKRDNRCVVVCQGFYEWLRKGPGGKEKVPHYVKRRDGELMCFAGLWDCVSYEGSDEKLYTYTVITTSSNSYLKFLHERMPVILDPGSDAMNTWLDPLRTSWSKELQSILKPYEGELECYPVHQDVGKVGNNSPNFIVPVDSKDNKGNIANFFANSPKKAPVPSKPRPAKDERPTNDIEWSEDNAPKPVPALKREHSPDTAGDAEDISKPEVETEPTNSSPQKKKLRSATQNSPMKGSNGTKAPRAQPITNFFKK
ncbi:unnamed protein product [Penicillium salamii]|nr:unnamed protein product [Penicillium salamii]CAG8001041.1 unnamed protein product [Penicillium salamii]CAG8283467.1 unnamed protein product [Penicillium salamii]